MHSLSKQTIFRTFGKKGIRYKDMTKQEFLKNLNEFLPEDRQISAVTDSEYAVIEKVYMFHPSISETNGKNEIAELYTRFGWAIIKDMLPRAELMAEKEREMADIKASMRALQQDMDTIKRGLV